MSRQLTWAVVSDGGTDRALIPIIRWAIHRLDPDVDILEPEFVKRVGPLGEYFETYEGNAMLVFAHRDAEGESIDVRLEEFYSIAQEHVVPVIPVRMTEAWLLIDAAAIAQAADRPDAVVQLPPLNTIDTIADPKSVVEQLMLEAAGPIKGRRRKRFKVSLVERRVNLATLINDYQPLESLNAFRRFQAELADRYPYKHHL